MTACVQTSGRIGEDFSYYWTEPFRSTAANEPERLYY